MIVESVNHIPKISAAVCHYNDGDTLEDTILSILCQSLDQASYEIILVDNGSTDGSNNLVSRIESRYPQRLTVVSESQPGLSQARNRAIHAAQSPIVAFIDADAVADRNWLAELLNVFTDAPDVGAVGGAVHVQWDHLKPHWWTDELSEALNHYVPADHVCRLSYPRYPYGTNFALRKEAVTESELFSPRLGRQGHNLLAAEEGDLCWRMEQRGWQIYFTPAAVVHHRTDASRLSRWYILKRAFCHGRSQRVMEVINRFDSDAYPGWTALGIGLVEHGLRGQLGLPYFKYWLFRLGYRFERTFGRGHHSTTAAIE